MKNKILLALVSLLIPLIGMAQRITDDEAVSIASQVLGKQVMKTETKKPVKAPSKDGMQQTEPFYSIYTGEDGQGFVIVSTDRRAPQVIGYGDGKADANNLPPQLKAILAKQDSVLQATPNLPEHSSWRKKAPTRAGEEGGKLLKTANWGQGYPYNLMTPEINGEHCPTGCVATAMAIIMKYHGWPEKGRGEHTYDWNGEKLSFDYSNTTFDWSQMPEEFEEGNYTEAQAQEVSKLMRAAGNAIDMEYSKYDSYAYFSSVSFNLYRYFKYELPRAMNKNRIYSDYPEISDNDWYHYIVNELESDRILLYSAQMHCFIIDGYSAEMMHINWGWDGTLNGYFNIINPETPLGNINGGTIISLILPDNEASDNYATVVYDDGSSCSLMNGGYSQGINIDATNIECGGHYRAVISSLLYTSNQGKIRPGLALVDLEDQVKVFYPFVSWWWDTDLEIDYANVPNGTTPEVGIDVTVSVSPTDKIKVAYQREGYDGYFFAKNAPFVNESCPVVNNDPDYINVDWEIDEGIDLTLSLGSLSYAEYNHPITQILKHTTALIRVKSDIGIPTIYIDGEKASAADSWGIRAINGCHKDFSVCIRNQKYNDMLNLNINVNTEGSLSSLITAEEAPLIKGLRLSGRINYEDLYFIRKNLVSIEKLDLSETEYIPDNFIAESYVLGDAGLIRELLLPKNLKGIGNCTFAIIRALKQIYIPSSVEFIGIDAFGLCQSLNTVIVGNPIPVPLHDDPNDISTSTFFNTTPLKESGNLYVPKGSKEAYMSAEHWKDFPNIIEYEGEWHETVPGDVNSDGKFTISDITFTANHIMGTLGEGNEFYAEAADIDKDGQVLVNDLTAIIDLVHEADIATNAPARAPQRDVEAALSVFEMSEVQTADNVAAIDVSVKSGYIATQFDVMLTEGASLSKMELNGKNAQTHKMTYRRLDDGRVRVVIFSMDNAEMEDNLVRLTLQGNGEVLLTNALVNEMQADGKIVEKAAADVRAMVSGSTPIIKNSTEGLKVYAVVGAIVIESDKPQSILISNVAGIVRKVNVGAGTTRVSLPAGVYMVNNVKLIIR